ncbi:FecR family protein [Flectobacillus longus]|uniref:FecR family protein n=1 Tax=Flectobacillus longus TaxID=2984207 RepID=UPI0024B7C9A4|nr:FecR domain-containing protein [Flectobacillus longus]MDI9882245.1 FecR domain-containing protein [Flectobacillus longus]
MNYSHYNTIDFVKDDFFCRWVQNPDKNTNTFWQDFMRNHPEKRTVILEAKSLVKTLGTMQATPIDEDASLEKIWNGVELEMQMSEKPSYWQRFQWQLAASVLLLIGLGYWTNYYQRENRNYEIPQLANYTNKEIEFVENQNTTNQPLSIQMSDGSEIVLQKHTRIKYPKVFEKSKREVYLVGEAFFKVKRNPQRPFIIYTKKLITQVLGTSFTIKANPDIEEERVIVKTGKVSVLAQAEVSARSDKSNVMNPNTIIVTPNQEVVYELSKAKLVKKIVELPQLLANTYDNQVFIYQNTSLTKVFSDLEKAYGIKIVYDSKRYEDCTINGNLSDETMFDKLNSITKITGLSYQVVDAQIIISGQGCNY